jgi:lysophospholipase L1-like esterase
VGGDFDSRHFATCGYQAAQARKVVAAVVRDARPTCMLLMLGFNDLAWFVSDADGLFRSIRTIIRRARRVRPRLRFAVANVVHRTWMKDREDLVESTDRYNALLRDAVREWSTERSPVALVDVAAVYGCGPQYKDQCPAAFDGLRASSSGEWSWTPTRADAVYRSQRSRRVSNRPSLFHHAPPAVWPGLRSDHHPERDPSP